MLTKVESGLLHQSPQHSVVSDMIGFAQVLKERGQESFWRDNACIVFENHPGINLQKVGKQEWEELSHQL